MYNLYLVDINTCNNYIIVYSKYVRCGESVSWIEWVNLMIDTAILPRNTFFSLHIIIKKEK